MINPKRASSVVIYLLVGALVVTVAFFLFRQPGGEPQQTPSMTDVVNLAKQGSIRISQEGESLMVYSKTEPPQELLTKKVPFYGGTQDLQQYLLSAGVSQETLATVDIEPKAVGFNWSSLIGSLLPVILLIGLFWFLMRRSRAGNNQAFNFSRSRARLADSTKPTVTFADVAGAEESKQELLEVVEFLKMPAKFTNLGAKVPRGVLLVGPPGTGKTLLARAVAGEAGVPFFSISGSEFVEMFVGVGASRVRDLFDQAKRNAPCIVFVDEIDAVGRHRGAGLGGGHDEREQTLNQLLVEMDGFDPHTNIIVIAATNRPDILDPALLRPGRFDRTVVMDRPDIVGRDAILKVHAKGKPLEEGVDLKVLAKQTMGFTGADLANLLNEAALLAGRRNKKAIGMDELEESIDRVIAGPQKKSRVVSQREKEITAYHEAGHALVAHALPHADPVHKVSIVARGMMGGYTRLLPTEDKNLWSRSQFNDMLAVSLAGYAAEQVFFMMKYQCEITTGATKDLEQANKLARSMVTEYGMSEKLGPRTFGRSDELVFVGRVITEQRGYGDKVADQIDDEVQRLIETAHARAREILDEGKARLVQLTKHLMLEETVEGEGLQKILGDRATAVAATSEQTPSVPKKRRPLWLNFSPSGQISAAI